MSAIVAASGPFIAWLVICLALVLLALAGSLAWDTGRRITARHARRRRPSWARWRRLKAAHRAARWYLHTFLLYANARWGI